MHKQLLNSVMTGNVTTERGIKKLIENQYQILSTSLSLQNYLTHIDFYQTGLEDEAATFYIKEKKIEFFYEGITRYIDDGLIYFELLTKFEQELLKNAIVTSITLHECNHALEEKIKQEEKSIESSIYSISDPNRYNQLLTKSTNKENSSIIILKSEQAITNYEQQYFNSPTERMAEIKAYQTIVNVLSGNPLETPNLLNYYQTLFNQEMLFGYVEENRRRVNPFFNGPFIEYMKNNGNLSEMEMFDWYSDDAEKCFFHTTRQYSFPTRLYYGLPISNKEYNKVYQKIITTPKYKLDNKDK